MTFQPRKHIYFLIPIPILAGLVLFTFTYSQTDFKSESQQENFYFLTSIILIFFIGLPVFTIKYLKTITWDNGFWTVKYPYLKRTVTFDSGKVEEIVLVKGIGGGRVPRHDQINVKTKDNVRVYINSLETSDFEKIRELLSQDFIGKFRTTSFLG